MILVNIDRGDPVEFLWSLESCGVSVEFRILWRSCGVPVEILWSLESCGDPVEFLLTLILVMYTMLILVNIGHII